MNQGHGCLELTQFPPLLDIMSLMSRASLHSACNAGAGVILWHPYNICGRSNDSLCGETDTRQKSDSLKSHISSLAESGARDPIS